MTARNAAELLSALAVPGNVPITNSIEALLELGFVRCYPQIRAGHDARIWERNIDGGTITTPHGLRRQFARQRALLDPAPPRIAPTHSER